MNDGEIVAIAPRDIAESKALSKDLALASVMPQALRKKPEDVLAIILTGAELGLAPMQAVRGLHIINGRVSLSADLMGALCKRSAVCEYLLLGESTGAIATYKTKRKGEPGETVMSFTIEQAKAAGLNGDNWKKYPDAMLRARCLAAICRAVYPDLCLGLYDADSGEIEEPTEKPVESAQRVHVEQVKEQLKAQIKPEITDAEIIMPTPVEAMAARIQQASNAAKLAELMPEVKAFPPADIATLKPVYLARKAALEAKQ